MDLIQYPEWTNLNIGISCVQVLLLGSFFGEVTGPAGYSKFAHEDAKFKVPSRVGMVLIYAPSLFVAVLAIHSFQAEASSGNGREMVTRILLAIHFGKRVLECLFLHVYSGTMDGDALFIPIFYALQTINICYQQSNVTDYRQPTADLMYSCGLMLFVVGQLGNLYHHNILANLRKGDRASKANKYVLPTGGFFEYVTMPHYFFEIVAWIGLACVTQQLNVFLNALSMTSYLAGRAQSTTLWYKERLAYPPERRHLIPFVF